MGSRPTSLLSRLLAVSVLRELRTTIRALARTPRVALTCILSIGIGLAASFVASLVAIEAFRADFMRDARLVRVMETTNWTCPACYDLFTQSTLAHWRRAGIRSVEPFASFSESKLRVRVDDRSTEANVIYAEHKLLGLLGIDVDRGQLFSPLDDQGSAQPVALLNHLFWRRQFRSDSVIGKAIIVGGQAYQVIGILRPTRTQSPSADIWLSYGTIPKDMGVAGIGRLRPEMTVRSASAEFLQLTRRDPSNSASSRGAVAVVEADFAKSQRGNAFWLLVGAIALTFLIVSTNVATLLLLRVVTRSKDFAVRSALGASRFALLNLVFLETCAVVGLGVIVALPLVLSISGVLGNTLASIGAGHAFPTIGWSSIGIGVALVALTAVVTGSLPIAHVLRANPLSDLGSAGGQMSSPMVAKRLRHIILVVQTAVVVVLGIASTLLLNSSHTVRQFDLQYDATNLVGAKVTLSKPQEISYAALSERMGEAVRGVVPRNSRGSVSWVVVGLLRESDKASFTTDDGREFFARRGGVHLPFLSVDASPGALKVFGIPLVSGRDITDGDNTGSEPVVVVNSLAATALWGDASPIGRRLKLGGLADTSAWMRVVGVARASGAPGPDGFSIGLINGRQTVPLVFRPLAQTRMFRALPPKRLTPSLNVAVQSEPAQAPVVIRGLAKGLENAFPQEAVVGPDHLDRLSRSSGDLPRLKALSGLIATLALLGTVIAGLGIAGLASEMVARRTREFGIRIALGAGPAHVLMQVMRTNLALAGAGAVLGLASSLWFRWLLRHVLDGWSPTLRQGLLYGMHSLDMRALIGGLAILPIIILVASGVPAITAIRIQPIRALRTD